MAAVLLPIVQPTLDSSSVLNMLPNSANPYQTGNPSASRPSANHRSHSQGNSTLAYRGLTAVPVQTYTFQTQPQFRQVSNPVYRVPAAPSQIGRLAYPASASSASTASSGSSSQPSVRTQYQTLHSKDDHAVQHQLGRAGLTASSSTPDLSLKPSDDALRATPERYRNMQRRTQSTSGPTAMPTQEAPSILRHSTAFGTDPLKAPPRLAERPAHDRAGHSDDSLASNNSRAQASGRYRRRSMGTLESAAMTSPAQSRTTLDATPHQPPVQPSQSIRPLEVQPQLSGLVPVRPGAHQRKGSDNSISSAGSANKSSSAQNTMTPSSAGSTHIVNQVTSNRSSAAEAPKRSTAPSPLSRPVTAGTDASTQRGSRDGTTLGSSPAAQQLAALSEKDVNRGVKSRLRRAFSFGSAQELRKASGEATTPAERARVRAHNDENSDLTSEEAAVAAKQEAAGLGTAIYSGQGTLFGSTDNLSISSTASSASIMLRKMGRGAKKSARSLKGLFRPKSIIGAPVMDGGLSSATTGEISLVTVEAERERLDISSSAAPQIPADYADARLARESIDSKRPFTADVHPQQQDNKGSWGRKSVVASEFERAEVLADVRKSILKRSMTADSATMTPLVNTAALYGTAANTSSIAINSTPGTPDASEPGPGYFLAANRQASASTRSLPGGGSFRNISFNPRIQLHDVWSATEYDRRGDIATCNRLTPMLAQQIKEELNTFKMEMEVHEMSKPYTHFF